MFNKLHVLLFHRVGFIIHRELSPELRESLQAINLNHVEVNKI